LKFFFSSFNFKTDGEIQFIDITDQIQEIVEKSKIHQGMVFVFSPHATGAIILNENDQPLLDDFRDLLERHQGMVFVFSPHATGAIILNENDQPLLDDFKDLLERLIPKSGSYRHPINAHSHLRSIFMEPSKAIPVKDGRLALGTWQSIIWVEVDTRPRTRTVMVTVLGD